MELSSPEVENLLQRDSKGNGMIQIAIEQDTYSYVCQDCGGEFVGRVLSQQKTWRRRFCDYCRPRQSSKKTETSVVICQRCQQEFSWIHRRASTYPRTLCDSCQEPRQIEWAFEYGLKQLGLTVSDYNELLQDQDGRCGVCERTESINSVTKDVERFCVDHEHATGRVRGLLCRGCNWSMGLHESGYRVQEEKFGPYLSRRGLGKFLARVEQI